MKRISLVITAILALGLILASCATPPIDDMNRARDAVMRAENDANAVAYASNTLLQARGALDRMQTEADARRYDTTRSLAAEAISLAERAIADGRAGAARAQGEAENVVRDLGQLLNQTSNNIDAARRTGNLPLDFNAISREMDIARNGYEETRQSLAAGNYRDVISRGQIIRSILSDINERLGGTVRIASRK